MEEMKIEKVSGTEVLGTLVGTEIDRQIATAKAFPRDIERAIKAAEKIAMLTPAIAESCVYALPRKQKNDKTNQWETKILSGPSVRLAEIFTSQFGNMRSGARVIQNDGRTITAQGFCHDLETNNFVAFEVKRKITNKNGQPFSEDMQIVTGNAACKIAYRNAVFTVIPAALIGETYEKLLLMNKGNKEDLPTRRTNAIKWFEREGVTLEQIFEVLEIKTVEEIDQEKIQILSGMKSSINNGEFQISELFPSKEDKKGADKSKTATQETLDLMDSKNKT